LTVSGASTSRLIEVDDGTGHRGVDVGGGLDRFDYRGLLAGNELAFEPRQLDEYQITKQFLRMLGNADTDRCRPLRRGPIRDCWCT
jgi:hypothetical protein